MSSVREDILSALEHREIIPKGEALKRLSPYGARFKQQEEPVEKEYQIKDRRKSALPESIQLVSPHEVKSRRLNSQEGYAALLHAFCHIEFNAINLALDAAYRFTTMPGRFLADWLEVALEEWQHFSLLAARLQALGYRYGAFIAHNNLWEVADHTAYDPLVRMALVPRLLEAHGLDVMPGVLARITQLKDIKTLKVLEKIYREEVDHVRKGNIWFHYLCQRRGIDSEKVFTYLVAREKLFIFKGAVNKEARLKAGFTTDELERWQNFCY